MAGYFLYHSIGTFPGKARLMAEALARFSAIWSAEDDGQWPAALAARQTFVDGWRTLIGAPAGSLTTVESVTAGLHALVASLPPSFLRGRRVLVAGDCFPSLHFLLAGLAERCGFVLDTVPLRPGEHWVRDDDMIARWQPDVGLALLTLVTSTASYRCDLARLAAHGRAMGSLVGADITQGVGVVPFSVTETPVDFVVSSSLKWLCGTSGAGVLQVRPDLLADCTPELRGWFSQENPFSWHLDGFRFAPDARRFDNGTPAVLAAVASQPGLDWVAATGIEAVRANNLVRQRRLVEAAAEHGWRLASPAAEAERGGSVMIAVPDGVATAEVVVRLRAQALYCDARGRVLRLSPGVVTSLDAVEALCAALRPLIGGARATAVAAGA